MKTVKIVFATMVSLVVFQLSSLAQQVLPEVTVRAMNYKYIRSVTDTNAAADVRMLERMASTYSVKENDYYQEEYDGYSVSFYLPKGVVLATYDQDGKIVRTAERFQDVALPKAVRRAVADRFPEWRISKDVYLVNYMDEEGADKVYKLILQNSDKRLRVRVNEKGEFLK